LCINHYQSGGTATAALGNLSGRISKKIDDNSGLPCWSGFKIHTNSKSFINVVTVYQSTKSGGIHTNYMHQMNELNNKGYGNTDPRKQLLKDLQTLIHIYNKNKESTIILMDANNGLFIKSSLLPNFLYNTDLISSISNSEEYPPSHVRGSQCIDFFWILRAH
jgi:hypothetical protein